jgi:GNAT superfamily N-acetyltransferase
MIENRKLFIRSVTKADAKELSELTINNAEMYLKPHYSAEQWNVFIQYYSISVLEDKIERQDVFCACIENEIIGTIALENDFVVGFYTKKGYLGQGVGRHLMNHLEDFARQKGISKIKLAASPIALDFYHQNGWITIKECAIPYMGVDFIETLMDKDL